MVINVCAVYFYSRVDQYEILFLSISRPQEDAEIYEIVAGSNNVDGDTDYAQKFKVSEVVIHPQFDYFAKRYDIAMLRLSTNATINDFVRTACLPSTQDQSDFPAGTLCTVTGWGETSENGKRIE